MLAALPGLPSPLSLPVAFSFGGAEASLLRVGDSRSSSMSGRVRPLGRVVKRWGLCCDRRAFSCTDLNFSNRSDHLIPGSSRDFKRFGRSKVETDGVVGALEGVSIVIWMFSVRDCDSRSWSNVQVADRTDTIQAILERRKCRGLR